MTEVHRGKRHLFLDHLRSDGLHLGKVDAQKLNQKQVDTHDQEGHDDVHQHVGQDGHLRAGHGLECGNRDQSRALEGQQRLSQGHGQEHADEEVLPSRVLTREVHGLGNAQRNRP